MLGSAPRLTASLSSTSHHTAPLLSLDLRSQRLSHLTASHPRRAPRLRAPKTRSRFLLGSQCRLRNGANSPSCTRARSFLARCSAWVRWERRSALCAARRRRIVRATHNVTPTQWADSRWIRMGAARGRHTAHGAVGDRPHRDSLERGPDRDGGVVRCRGDILPRRCRPPVHRAALVGGPALGRRRLLAPHRGAQRLRDPRLDHVVQVGRVLVLPRDVRERGPGAVQVGPLTASGADSSLAIATIIIGWVLSGYSIIVGLTEAILVARHGASAFRSSFYDVETPRRKTSDFSTLPPPILRGQSPPSDSPRQIRTHAGPRFAVDEKESKGSASSSEVSMATFGPGVGARAPEYLNVDIVPWGAAAKSPTSTVEILTSPPPQTTNHLNPRGYVERERPVLDAGSMRRPSRFPVDRRNGYIADGNAGRGVRSRSPTRFVTDHYTRPVTPPTRRASHQRSLSQANQLPPPTVAPRMAPLSHTRSKSWDYI